jgi:hypothetical protein
MIEILRQLPQSNLVLLLFFVLALISVFLYNKDSKRFRYFYRSLFSKQFEITYGRQIRLSHYFIVLLSLQSILITTFIASSFLRFHSSFENSSNLFAIILLVLIFFLALKWLVIYGFGLLFRQEKVCNYFILLSAKLVNLTVFPVIVLSVFLYLNYGFTHQISSIITSLLLLSLVLAKIIVFTQMRKLLSMNLFYIILYLCIFEIVPFLWLLIGLNR